ncbi:hypothetical protein Tco_1416745 [Tanacetum coccineum]
MSFCECDYADTMVDVNVNAPAEEAPAMVPPTRTDDQILPRIRWVPVGKSNCYLDVERSQNNPIYKIALDILKNTNFFRAFIASSTIVRYDKITGCYRCQLDEQWFNLTKDTLRDALQITPVDTNNPFSTPPTPDALIKFVNDLGFERPRALVLQILWGVVNRAHIDYAERMWEEFTQSIHTFIEDKKNLAQHTQGKNKATLIVIPSVSLALREPNEKSLGKPKRSLQLIDEVVDEGVPDKEPLYGDEEADTQRAIEESLKEVHGAHRGPLPPVVFREPDSGKFQPLPEVQDRYIFQRCTSTQTEPSGHDESSLLYAELSLTDSETESDEEVLPVIQSGAQDEGQAGPKPGIQDEAQTGSNPGDVAVSQHQSSHVVHAGPNLKHMDFEVTDTLIQQNPEQIDEEFTTTAYLNVQVNLKLPTEDQVRLEEPASSARTLSSLQHLDKELSFADQFLVEKS